MSGGVPVCKGGTHFLLLCFCKVESGAVSNSYIVWEKKLYPYSQKTVSSLHYLFYAFSILRRGRKKEVTYMSLVCSWVERGEGLALTAKGDRQQKLREAWQVPGLSWSDHCLPALPWAQQTSVGHFF